LQSPALCREEKLSAIQAKEDNRHLREKIAEYDLRFKRITKEKAKMKVRLDYLEMENQALLRNKKEHRQEIHNLQTNISELTLQSRALEKDNEAKQVKIQVVSEVKESLQLENCTLRQEKHTLQQKLSLVQSENDQYRLSQQESIAFGLQPWKISRERIKLGKVIGGGGWGAVSEGDLQVAVKQFYPTIISSQNLARLRREMEILARIRHPNLLQFIGVVFEDDDNADIHSNPPYIITELLDMSLREAYEKGKVSEENFHFIFQDTARALDYLHRHHEPIVHRDVSSANVLLKGITNGLWMAKVSDLGSANLAKDAVTKNEGAIIYCAPEAFTDKSNTHSETLLTPKIDVYSYGIMLCEVINRTLPDQDKLQHLLEQARDKQPQLYSQIIIKCINQDPKERPYMANVLIALDMLSSPKLHTKTK
jgi:serine/threonine protein kinase